MPDWGLTPEQRTSAPWGIEAELLAPAKLITDPVHGDIYLTELERRVLDTPPMQRLRRVRQLGSTQLVYPGATHSRFSHSLGSLRAAQDLLDVVIGQRNSVRPVSDLFSQWLEELKDRPAEERELGFNQKVAQATVLIRLGALLHDLCHVPFGHSIEDELGILTGHDANVPRYQQLWRELLDGLPDPATRTALSGDLKEALRPLILSKEYEASDTSVSRSKTQPLPPPLLSYEFALDIVGNTICADLLDYIRRDHLFTGLPAEFGRRFLQGFYVSRSDHQYFPSRMVVRITKGKHLRADVISELFKFLRYRYELSERALAHHAKLAADAMVAKLLEIWRDLIWIEEAERRLGRRLKKTRDVEAIAADIRRNDPEHASAIIDHVEARVRRRLEREFTRWGDDGLLEHLRSQHSHGSGRRGAIFALSEDLLNRRLFKEIAVCSSARASAKAIYQKHGRPEDRKRLERGAAYCAELSQGWHVVLWIPPPQMRMKAAGVLVDDGNMLARLDDYDRAGGKRGLEIYESHEALWAVRAFAHQSVVDQQPGAVPIALAYLAEKLGLGWDEERQQATLLGLAVEQVATERGVSDPIQKKSMQLLVSRASLAAKRAAPVTRPALAAPTEARFSDLKHEVQLTLYEGEPLEGLEGSKE